MTIAPENTSRELREVITMMGHDPYLITTRELQEIANKLSKMAMRETPWGWRYLRNVINEKQQASQALINAIHALGAHIDGTPEDLAGAHQVVVMARGDITPGSLVAADSRQCAYPPCNIHFVPTHPRAKYHSPDCARKDYNRRRRKS